jgi:hypothetical protein
MGAVHKAHDRELERDVGLKLMAPELAGTPKHSLVSSRNCGCCPLLGSRFASRHLATANSFNCPC